MVVYRPERKTYLETLPVGEITTLSWPRLSFAVRTTARRTTAVSRRRRALKVLMDPERVILPLIVRNIEPGDRFRPLGMRGTKKVGDYLTDRKVPAVYRDEIPVVCDGAGIVWLVGFELSDRVKIDAATRKVLTVECSERPPDEAEAV